MDMIDIAEMVTETLNDNQMIPDGVTAERQWELQMHRTDFDVMRVSVLPVPTEPKEEQEDLSTRGQVAERVNIHVGVQKKVPVTHVTSMAGGKMEIRHHDKHACDDVARVALGIQNAFRRARLQDTRGIIQVLNDKALVMGDTDHLQSLDIFTAVISLEIVPA